MCYISLLCCLVFNQSDREKSEGLPVAPFMDRDKVTKPTAQIGFIKFVLIPMFETVMKVSKSCCSNALNVFYNGDIYSLYNSTAEFFILIG